MKKILFIFFAFHNNTVGTAWRWARRDIEQPREGEVNLVINGKRCIIKYAKSAKTYYADSI